jgi:transcriptional regulator with XRE-family HTH domain
MGPSSAEAAGGCSDCGRPLSQRNPGRLCQACASIRQRAEADQPGAQAGGLVDGEKLAQLRHGRGWTQEMLADRAGVSIVLVRKLEQNARRSARVSTLSALGRALNVPVGVLISDTAAGGEVGAPTQPVAHRLREAENTAPTLLRALVVERHWQRFQTFQAQFRHAAKNLAEREHDPDLAKLTVSSRQWERWYAGQIKTEPHPDACRVLEHMFGYPVSRLLGSLSQETGQFAGEFIRESGSPAADPVGWKDAPSSEYRSLGTGNDGQDEAAFSSVTHVSPAPELMDDMNRRELLRILSMAGTLLAIPGDVDWERLDHFANRTGRLDRQTVEEYAALNTHLWRVFVLSRTKHVVFPLVRDQLDVLTNSLSRAGSEAAYRRLCELTSSLFQLAGEILFDRNEYTDAAHCYTLAATASKEAGVPDLWACALTRHAFIGIYERRFAKSAPMLELAAGLARRGDSALATRHWVAIVQAQTFAGLGDLDACQRALDVAGQVDNLQGAIQNGGWLRFDSSRLAEERGACYVQLRRTDLAESALTDALRLSLSVRRRGCVLIDLAMLGTQRRDLDQISSCTGAAIELFLKSGSGVIARKLKSLQPHLAPFVSDGRVRDLNSRIASFGTGVTAP